MKSVNLGVALLGLLAAAVVQPAAAQMKDVDTGIYLGASGGATHFTKTCDFSTVPCDDKDMGFRVFGGYKFNRWLSAEFGYADLGESSGDGQVNGQSATFTHATYAFDITAVGMVQVVGNLSAYGSLGIYLGRTKLNQEVGGVPSGSAGDTQHNYVVGLGLQYNLGKLGIRAGFNRYSNVGNEGTTIVEDDVDFYSLGVLWQF